MAKSYHPSLDGGFKRRARPAVASPSSSSSSSSSSSRTPCTGAPAVAAAKKTGAAGPTTGGNLMDDIFGKGAGGARGASAALKAGSAKPKSRALPPRQPAVGACPAPPMSAAEEAKAEARARGRSRGRRKLGERPAAGSIVALRKPAAVWTPPPRTGPVRASLSEQLASIGQAAGSITAGIREDFGLPSTEKALKTTAARCFVVGKLTSRYPSPVQFYADRCTYTFHHPFEAREIAMSMFYCDMKALALRGPTLAFRIAHHLVHFGDDYDPARDVLTIELSSSADASWVQEVVIPKSRAAPSGFRVTSCGTAKASASAQHVAKR